MHIKDEEFGRDIDCDGKTMHIPDLETCKERVDEHFQFVLDRLKFDPRDMILVLDQPSPGEARKRKYDYYKANRIKRPYEYYAVFNPLMDHVCDLVKISGGTVAEARVVPSVEADDLINELACRLPNVTIWSQDKDLLVAPAEHHYIGNELDPVKFPVPSKYIRLYRSLIGDASDNIPGCRGFGEKTWNAFFEKYGPEGVAELQGMVENHELHLIDDSEMPKLKLLRECAQSIYESYDLIGFLPVPPHKVDWKAGVTEVSKLLVTADNFQPALFQMQRELQREQYCVIDFETDTPIESDAWVEQTKNDDGKGGVSVDVMASEITGMGLKVADKTFYFSVNHLDTNNISLSDLEKVLDAIGGKRVYAHNSTGFENVVLYNTFGRFLPGMVDTLLMASYVNEVGANGLKPLSKSYLNYQQKTYDATLAEARANREATGDQRPVRGMSDITGDEVVEYGIDDVITCDSLQNLFQIIMLYEGSLSAFEQVDIDSAFVTSLAFCKGVDFDWAEYNKMREENDLNIIRAREELEQMLIAIGYGDSVYKPLGIMTRDNLKKLYASVTGSQTLPSKARTVAGVLKNLKELNSTDENMLELIKSLEDGTHEDLYKARWKPYAGLDVNSAKVMNAFLYDFLRCPVRVRAKVTAVMRSKGQYIGNPSADEDAIENAIAFNDVGPAEIAVLRKIIEYKGYLTKHSLFFHKYPDLVHWKTGKLHCSMRQCGTSTRRFSHSAPNLAQLPKKKGKEVRNMLTVPGPDWVMDSQDMEGQELKLAAWRSQCPVFLSCYTGPKEQRRDVHSLTGVEVDLKSAEPKYGDYATFKAAVDGGVWEAELLRGKGKTVNFATQYLCQPPTLAKEMRDTVENAALYIQAKDAAFPGLMPGTDKFIAESKERRYAVSMLGAVRHLARDFAIQSASMQAAAGRLAWSYAIQGSAAEQIKLAMSKMWRYGLFDSGLVYVAIQIHDELVFMFHKSVLGEVVPIINDIMTQQYADMEIDAATEAKIGTHFGSLKNYEVKV